MNPPCPPVRHPRELLSRMPPKGQTVVASTRAAGWEGIHGVVLDGPIAEFVDLSATFPFLLFLRKGSSQLDWRRGNRFSRQTIRAGDLLVAPGCEGHRLRAVEPIEAFLHPIDPDRLDQLARDEWPETASAYRILEGLHRDDEGLWDLGRRLADRILDPIPGSRACAAALQELIALQILWDHSTITHPRGNEETLADPRLSPVIEYIRRNLRDDVSLETLAALAGLSPNYFLGAFREATGQTPHRYVTELRIARACELLRDPHRPITEVSLAVGFSSQSHLTEVFRRTMKTTPAAYRRQVLGLGRDNGTSDG